MDLSENVIRHFRLGHEPSRIDREMRLPIGTAHDVIVQYWAWVKARSMGK